jgi:hypothetical protein
VKLPAFTLNVLQVIVAILLNVPVLYTKTPTPVDKLYEAKSKVDVPLVAVSNLYMSDAEATDVVNA